MKIAIVVIGLTLAGLAAAVPVSAGDLNVGDQAPNFKLQASDGKTYQLSDFKGKESVVLAWFPKAFTQGCTIECKSLAEHGDMIKQYNAQYFMISVDPLEDNIRFAKETKVQVLGRGGAAGPVVEKKEADFPQLSDPTKQTAQAYVVLNEQSGFANRWTFYIGKDGKITAIDKQVKPATSAEDMAAMLKQLGTEERKK
jgi:peroxiredoxin Q/BCP